MNTKVLIIITSSILPITYFCMPIIFSAQFLSSVIVNDIYICVCTYLYMLYIMYMYTYYVYHIYMCMFINIYYMFIYMLCICVYKQHKLEFNIVSHCATKI